MRKTKIIATIGPASERSEMLKKLIKSGVNVCRLNMSHDIHKNHQIKIDKIKKIRQCLEMPVAIMIDTKGPEIRIGEFKDGEIFLNKNDEFSFVYGKTLGDKTKVSLNIIEIFKKVKKGDKIIANNGLLPFVVLAVKENEIKCKALASGKLSNRKSLNIPSVILKRPYLSDADKKDLDFARKNDVEYIAASFVSQKQDILDLKKYLNKNDIAIISKIENQQGIDNIDEIIDVSDGIMIARGDMGIEIDLVKLPSVQKMIMQKCIEKGKIVITATEMLESMITNPRPTRAEVNDIATAVFDGSSAIMLSGETAMGKYPVECVKIMDRIASECEKNRKTQSNYIAINSSSDAIVYSAVETAKYINAKAIVNFTHFGNSAKKLASFMPEVPVFSMTNNIKTYQQMSLYYGIYPHYNSNEISLDELFVFSAKFVKEKLKLKKNDTIIISCGTPISKSGKTNTLKIEQIK